MFAIYRTENTHNFGKQCGFRMLYFKRNEYPFKMLTNKED